jgi:prepilin-type N-terminal cleavage/methylation domain-containing protein
MNLPTKLVSPNLPVSIPQHFHKGVSATLLSQKTHDLTYSLRTTPQATNRASAGFTLTEIMIVAALIGLLAAIAVPNFVRARSTSQRNACINNLRQIDAAKQEWAFDSRSPVTATPTPADLQPYLGRGASGNLPACPADPEQRFATSYRINSLQFIPACRIAPSSHALPASPDSSNHGGGDGGGGDGR